MDYTTEYIGQKLKAARLDKGLSQRELSERAGVPQGHISRIESGVVDLRLSSFVELARALDLELALVPRSLVPAVNAVARGAIGPVDAADRPEVARASKVTKDLRRLQENAADLHLAYPKVKEWAELQRWVGDLQQLRFAMPDTDVFRKAFKTLQAFRRKENGLDEIRATTHELQKLHHSVSQFAANSPTIDVPRPAYSLSEDDDD